MIRNHESLWTGCVHRWEKHDKVKDSCKKCGIFAVYLNLPNGTTIRTATSINRDTINELCQTCEKVK